MTVVKFCGFRNIEAVEYAAEFGADYVGFVVMAPDSRREIELELAQHLIKETPPEVEPVLVTPENDIERLVAAIERCRPHAVQLSGERDGRLCEALRQRTGVELWQAFSPSFDEVADIALLDHLTDVADAIVFDNMTPDGYGGTGDPMNWAIARALAEPLGGFPIMLAGGLDADNVAEAIRVVLPWGVDVSSGIEDEDGDKDPERMRAFAEGVAEAG